jgi:hypothetical protein
MDTLQKFRCIENQQNYDENKVVKHLISNRLHRYICHIQNYEITEEIVKYAIYYEDMIFLKYFYEKCNESIGIGVLIYTIYEKKRISLQFILENCSKDIPLFMFKHRLEGCDIEYRNIIESYYESHESDNDDSSISDFSE